MEHHHNIMLVGSCFTENIGEKLSKHKWNILQNPNGILFNPVSVSEAIINIVEQKQYTKEDLFYYNEAYHSWQHHSKFSSLNAEEAIEEINTSTNTAHLFLKTANTLIITLGSAWIYTLTDEALNASKGSVAANNHKAPHSWFEKKLMTPAQVITVLGTMLDRVGSINKGIQVIFTISPVRHLREGAINNNRSKAVLIQAVHDLIDYLPNLFYFPAYELVMDDLRDYRFFAEDLVHPNYAATNYVWEKMVQSCFSESSQQLLQQIADINLAFNHKPFNATSNQHKAFLKNYLAKTQALKQQYSYINFEEELNYFAQNF
jgi:hypothetical protein